MNVDLEGVLKAAIFELKQELIMKTLDLIEKQEQMNELINNYFNSLEKVSVNEAGFYKLHSTNIIYIKQDDLIGYMQRIIFSKIDKDEQLFERIEPHPLRYVTINKERYEAFYCNDYGLFKAKLDEYFMNRKKRMEEKKLEQIKKTKANYCMQADNFPAIKAHNKKRARITAPIKQEEIIMPKKDEEKDKGMLRYHFDEVIGLLETYFDPKETGNIEIKKVIGQRGHHFPSKILKSINEVGIVAPIKFVSMSRKGVDKNLKLEITNNYTVGELINHLRSYYIDNLMPKED